MYSRFLDLYFIFIFLDYLVNLSPCSWQTRLFFRSNCNWVFDELFQVFRNRCGRPLSQFHHHFTSSFQANNLTPKQYNTKCIVILSLICLLSILYVKKRNGLSYWSGLWVTIHNDLVRFHQQFTQAAYFRKDPKSAIRYWVEIHKTS